MKHILFTKNLLAIFILGMMFTFCSEKDPFPLSNASFRVASDSPERYQEVKFENLSTNAKTYEWDFGDGTPVSNEIAAVHTYEESATYSVTLRAFTEDNQVSTETQVIEIGERYLTGMFIININMLDAEGKPWDQDGSGPDVLMQLGPTADLSGDRIEGFFVDSLNVGTFQTPIGIRTTDLLSPDYKLTNEEFFILLEEVDTIQVNQMDSAIFTQMIELRFNPVIVDGEAITEVKRGNGTGDLTIPFIVVDQYQFFLEFEVR